MMDNKKSASSVAMSEETPANLHAAGQANAKESIEIIEQNGVKINIFGDRLISYTYYGDKSDVVEEISSSRLMVKARDDGKIYIDGSPTMKYIKRQGSAGRVNIAGAADAYIIFKEALNLELEEIEAIEIIMSFNRAGQTYRGNPNTAAWTAGQYYGKQRHGQGTAMLSQAQKREICALFDKLSTKKMKIVISPRAVEMIGLNPSNFGIVGLEAGDEWELPIISLIKNNNARLRGKKDVLFIADKIPILAAISSALNQGIDYPQSMNGIKRYDTEKGEWIPWNLTTKRIRTRAALKMYVQEAYSMIQHDAGRGFTVKVPYETIAKLSSRIKQRNMKRELNEIQSEAAVILDWWAYAGIIKSWGRYKNKNSKSPDGVQMTLFNLNGLEAAQ